MKLVMLVLCLVVGACKQDAPRPEPVKLASLDREIAAKAQQVGETIDVTAKAPLDSVDKLKGLGDGFVGGDDGKVALGKDSCSRGSCKQICKKGGTCELTCSGGNCKQTCEKDATCEMTCSGGSCTQTCEPDAESCKLTCSGGACTQKCEGNCKKTCSGKRCK